MKLIRMLGFLFLISFGATIFITSLSFPRGETSQYIQIHIGAGENLQDIAQTLKEHGLIRSTTAFRLYLKSQDLDREIKSGSFVLNDSMSFAEIAEMLRSSEKGEMVITIPEGYTVSQIDVLLAETGLITEGDLLDCAKSRCDFSSFDFLPAASSAHHHGKLEGYLFPDTYFVDPTDFVSKFFLERLLGTFRSKVVDDLGSEIAASGRSLEDIITMASLIERETREESERAIVSGILWKRFDENRGLDVDATIRYALDKITEPLTKSDLENKNPYNTRRHAGLPPGPIANPGLDSIRAALYPEDSDYWYYLHGKDGKIRYAETNEEHNVNKAKYL